MNFHITSIIQEIIENMQSIFAPGVADRMDSLFLRLMDEVT